MTEADWLASTDPAAMLARLTDRTVLATAPAIGFPHGRGPNHPATMQVTLPNALRDIATPRKLRLFACACRELCVCSPSDEWDAAAWAAFGEGAPGCPCTRAARAALLRCLFGNPWRPVPRLTGWTWGRSWLDAVAVARDIYDERRWEDTPILADALEEAGCDSEDLLAHLRGVRRCPGCSEKGKEQSGWCRFCDTHTDELVWVPDPQAHQHARGCWALDLIMGRE